MHAFRTVLFALCALFLCVNGLEQRQGQLRPRQDGNSAPPSTQQPSAAPTSSPSSAPPSTAGPPASSGSGSSSSASSISEQANSAASSSAVTSSADSPSSTATSIQNLASSAAGPPANLSNSIAASINGTAPKPNELPIQPAITPGWAVAGVILMLSGAVFTVIGIKNRRLHIYLSTGFLASLAVTVLIIYVMHPPISNAVQGAYVVASTVTGLIFGALSIVFPEVTEGLGCLLGGFCLSMWFLVLKPGGLLQSTGARAIFIAAFSLAAFALSFSHYTRSYGLIGTISFGGATVTVLGIDCFSRAGLKEFWVYIWNLNDNLLPLGTTTFPHTRGIRVEIACIILIFLLGIISQMKLWKVIQARRERKEKDQAEEQRQWEELDEDAGRRVERSNRQDRSQWEAEYGDKEEYERNLANASISDNSESVRKASTVVENRELDKGGVENIEMAELEESQHPAHRSNRLSDSNGSAAVGEAQNGNGVTVRVADDDTIPASRKSESADAAGSIRKSKRHSKTQTVKTAQRNSGLTERNAPEKGSKRASAQSAAPPPPAVVPLPFKVPVHEDDNGSERSSVATFADSDRAENPKSKRTSGGSAMRRISLRSPRQSAAFTESEENLVVPHDEEDRASSLDATLDELTDSEAASFSSRATPQPFPEDDEKKDTALADAHKVTATALENDTDNHTLSDKASENVRTAGTPASGKHGEFVSSEHQQSETESRRTSGGDVASAQFPEPPKAPPTPQDSSRPLSLTSSTDPKTDKHARRKSSASNRLSGTPMGKRSRSVKSLTPSEKSGRESVVSLAEQLPERLSKVALSYRTNEWAKHLDSADAPDLDELEVDASEGMRKRSTESAAPVDVAQLQQTATNGAPRAMPRSTSQKSVSTLNQVQSPLSQLANTASVYLPEDPQALIGRTASLRSLNAPPSVSPINASMVSLPANASNPYLSRSISMNTLPVPGNNMARSFRSSSTPISSQILLESPSEDALPGTISPARSGPSPLPSNTLIGKRDSMLRNKYSSLSINQLPSTPEIASQVGPNDSVSVLGEHSPIDEESMSLAERKDMIKQQQSQNLMTGANWPLTAANQPFDSHQPRRESTVDPQRRENQLAQWRESLRNDISKENLPKAAAEDRRQQMINDKQASALNKHRVAMANSRRDSLFDEKMRRGEMLDLHKEAMRRMQANANKHV